MGRTSYTDVARGSIYPARGSSPADACGNHCDGVPDAACGDPSTRQAAGAGESAMTGFVVYQYVYWAALTLMVFLGPKDPA